MGLKRLNVWVHFPLHFRQSFKKGRFDNDTAVVHLDGIIEAGVDCLAATSKAMPMKMKPVLDLRKYTRSDWLIHVVTAYHIGKPHGKCIYYVKAIGYALL